MWGSEMAKASVTACIWLLVVATVLPVESQEHAKYSVLAVEYFGSLDHPIYPVVISDSYSGAETYRNALIGNGTLSKFSLVRLHVVSPYLLRRLIATAESHKDGVQAEPGKQNIYNGVSISIVSPQGRKTFSFHIEPAITLLDQLKRLCKDDKLLSSDLSEFQASIRPWGDMSLPRPSPQTSRDQE
jgi:hypothetical protein